MRLQASELRQHAAPEVFEAFCRSRLQGDWGYVFGTLDSTPELKRHRRAGDGDAALRGAGMSGVLGQSGCRHRRRTGHRARRGAGLGPPRRNRRARQPPHRRGRKPAWPRSRPAAARRTSSPPTSRKPARSSGLHGRGDERAAAASTSSSTTPATRSRAPRSPTRRRRHFDRVFDTNARSVWLGMKYALAHMVPPRQEAPSSIAPR